jgi:hypothetical protein
VIAQSNDMNPKPQFRSSGATQLPGNRAILFSVLCCAVCLFLPTHPAPVHAQSANQTPVYKQSAASIEARIDDLLRRMTLEEKARQLDMYSSAREIVDKHTDDTHAALDAVFLP